MLLMLLAGCTTVGEREDVRQLYKGQVAIFLKGPDKALLDVVFNLSAIKIVTDEGASSEIMSSPMTIDSRDVEGRQILLGEGVAPEGNYRKLQLIVSGASIEKKGRKARLALPPKGIELDINVSIKMNQSATLFINWNVNSSIRDGYLFKPIFTVKGKSPELGTLLIYVSNEDTDNVSVINRQSGEIVATVMVGNRPRGIAVSEGAERAKVYVANAGSNSISVIDPTTNSVDNEIPIRFGSEPGCLTFANVSSNANLIFVANYGSNNVSIVDPETFRELEKVDVGRGPVAIAADPPVSELTGTRFLSIEDVNTIKSYRENFINVYVVNQDSNEVSVLRIDRFTKRSVETLTLNVEWRPIALDVDYRKGKVYVANYGADKLSVIDILETVKGNADDAVSTINNVGTGIIGVISDPAFDRLYLLKERPGEIMIIKPFAEGFDTIGTFMPPVMGRITVGDLPRSFIMDPEGRKIYVVNRGSDNISVVDKTLKKEEQLIPVGKRPYGITVFQR